MFQRQAHVLQKTWRGHSKMQCVRCRSGGPSSLLPWHSGLVGSSSVRPSQAWRGHSSGCQSQPRNQGQTFDKCIISCPCLHVCVPVSACMLTAAFSGVNVCTCTYVYILPHYSCVVYTYCSTSTIRQKVYIVCFLHSLCAAHAFPVAPPLLRHSWLVHPTQ